MLRQSVAMVRQPLVANRAHWFARQAAVILPMLNTAAPPRNLGLAVDAIPVFRNTARMGVDFGGEMLNSVATADGLTFGSQASTQWTSWTQLFVVRPTTLASITTISGTQININATQLQCRIDTTGLFTVNKDFVTNIGTSSVGAVTTRPTAFAFSYDSIAGGISFSVNGAPAGTASNAQTIANGTFGIGCRGGVSGEESPNLIYLFATCRAPFPMAALCELTRDPYAILAVSAPPRGSVAVAPPAGGVLRRTLMGVGQ